MKSSATSGGERLERGPHSLVALLQSAYLTTDHATHRMRFNERGIPNPSLPSRFLRPLPVARRRMFRWSSHS